MLRCTKTGSSSNIIKQVHSRYAQRAHSVKILLAALLLPIHAIAALVSVGPGGVGVALPVVNSAPTWAIPDRSIERLTACTYDLDTVSSDLDGDSRTYTIVSGSLPTGCDLTGTVITGTATTNGAYTFALGVSDGETSILRPSFTSSAALSFTSVAFSPAQNEQFNVTFQITPVASNIDHVCGFGEVTATGYANLLAAVRMSTAGVFDARDNAAYAADNTVTYTGGTTYNVAMAFNVPAGTYDVTVDGVTIADDAVFRGAALPASLGYITCVDSGTPGTPGTISGPIRLNQPVSASVTWTVFAETDTTPPDAPVAPTITGVTQTTVTMSLPTSAAGDHSFYRIERSPSGCGSYAQIQDNYTSATFTDTGRTANTGYCYRLIDVDTAANASANGTGATATTSAVDVNALLSMANTSVTEGNSGTVSMTFTLTASASQAFNIVCSYQTQGGTADSGTDYTSASGTVQIDTGTTTEQINVTVNGDTSVEADETLQMRVYNCGQNGTSVNATEFVATGTITNDDSPPGTGDLSVAAESLAEGNSGLTSITFTVTLDGVVGDDVTFEYYTVDGSAVAWEDYVATSGIGIIRAGDTTFDVVVQLIGDSVAEGSETFTLRIANQGVVP